MIKTLTPKLKRTRIGSIITSVTSPSPVPPEVQVYAALDWCKAADRVVLVSPIKPPTHPDGLRAYQSKLPATPIHVVLGHYLRLIPGGEILAIAAPTVVFNPDQTKLINYLDENKLERSWALSVRLNEKEPLAFVLSAPVISAMAQSIPHTLTFEGDAWAKWMDAWFTKNLLPHRYFKADNLEILQKLVVPVSEVAA